MIILEEEFIARDDMLHLNRLNVKRIREVNADTVCIQCVQMTRQVADRWEFIQTMDEQLNRLMG